MQKRFDPEIGIGATDDLSLRVSVATLVRVLFERPGDGEVMLALERRATLHPVGPVVEIKSQPFGGAICIYDLRPLQSLIGDFHFDSEASRAEQDFRILIRPSDWETVGRFCIRHFNSADDSVLETSPRRELAEEFTEVLGISPKPEQYAFQAVGTVIEDHPSPTDNFYARDFPTVRMYRIFEARILDASLASALMNSENDFNDDLRERAFQDARNGGKGWANAVLTLPLHQISAFYEATSPEARNTPISYQNHRLDETVAAVLDHITVPKFRRL